jgi:asparagine synthase (glutamine-hydrolysing)
MCGISAIVGGQQERTTGVIESMVMALRHRGPDKQSYRRLKGCDLGHARLSIIDIDGGTQPMSDGSGRYWIVFNGEIYNYRELREELARFGCRFHTQSDTEVILAAYARWGVGCLDRFRGMFAFVIWDEHEQRLFAARDLFGEKPLYYAPTADGGWAFASELRSIRASDLVAPTIDRRSIDAYLCFGYLPPFCTAYRNVHVLPPGHYLQWQAGRPMRPRPYWQPVFEPQPIAADDAAERLRELMQQAVRRQMVADVPVGAFLSGGHDSSTIVALMQKQIDRPIKTFSVGFGDVINELPYARAVARQYRTEHHEIDLGMPRVGELLQKMADVYDEPFMDPSHVPTYLIAEYARRYVKVVLSGDGADELFGGYAWYPLLAQSEDVSGSLPAWLAARVCSRLLGDRVPRLARYSQAHGLARRASDPWSRYVQYRSTFALAERERLWGATAERPLFESESYRPNGAAHGFDRVLHFDLSTFLPGDILVKVDRAAMAHGLETRAPFLDRDVVEFALSLPASLKVTRSETKVLFKSALARYWPESLHRRPKQGFAAPYRTWLARSDVRSLLQHVFRANSPLRDLLPGVPSGIPTERNYGTWSLLTLGLWLERRVP